MTSKNNNKAKSPKPEKPDVMGNVPGKDTLTHRRMWCKPGTTGFTPDKRG